MRAKHLERSLKQWSISERKSALTSNDTRDLKLEITDRKWRWWRHSVQWNVLCFSTDWLCRYIGEQMEQALKTIDVKLVDVAAEWKVILRARWSSSPAPFLCAALCSLKVVLSQQIEGQTSGLTLLSTSGRSASLIGAWQFQSDSRWLDGQWMGRCALQSRRQLLSLNPVESNIMPTWLIEYYCCVLP